MDVDLGNLTLFSSELPESDMLIETATRLTQELISNIFQLPVEKSSVGPLAQLPTPTTPLPREKPVPLEKTETKWERFAREKGIKKQKRSRKIWDDNTQSYKYRWGKDSLAKSNEEWVVEHNPNKLGDFEDPFIQKKEEKKLERAKQVKAEIRNKRAAVIARNKSNMGGANPSSMVVGNMSSTSTASKDRLKRAIRLAQRSTRSLGVFDTKREDEPKVQKKKVIPSSVNEKASTRKIVNKVMKDIDRKSEFDEPKLVNNEIRSQQQQSRNKFSKRK